jgi:Tfp pilus assembly protein FimT
MTTRPASMNHSSNADAYWLPEIFFVLAIVAMLAVFAALIFL